MICLSASGSSRAVPYCQVPVAFAYVPLGAGHLSSPGHDGRCVTNKPASSRAGSISKPPRLQPARTLQQRVSVCCTVSSWWCLDHKHPPAPKHTHTHQRLAVLYLALPCLSAQSNTTERICKSVRQLVQCAFSATEPQAVYTHTRLPTGLGQQQRQRSDLLSPCLTTHTHTS